jgi:hypothetical protein
MIKISKELRNEMGKVVEESDQLKRDIRTLDDFDYLKEKILKENADWIVEKAYENSGGSFDGVIYLDLSSGELVVKTMSSNSYINEANWVKVYELSANWLANAVIRVNDILADEEWKELKRLFGEDQVDYLNRKQLKEINVDLDDRLKEALVFWIENN